MTGPGIEERVGILESGQLDIRTDIHEMRGEMREIRTDLAGRPTWAVTKALTFMGALSSMLATGIVALIIHIATSN